jgi:hypothetical protein
MREQINLAYPVDCLDSGFDDMQPEESFFYETPMTYEEMESF